MGQETEVVKSEAEIPESAKAEIPKVEPAKVEVAKVEAVKVENPIEVKPVEVKPDATIKIEKAKAIFEAMPHITTIWFDKNGDWRFYSTPGSTPINKEKS